MENSNSKTCSLRSDEKRSFLSPLAMILVGIALTAIGFVSQSKPVIGNIRSEYQFNRAVVTNSLPKEKPPPATKINPAAKPQKKSR